MAKIRGGIGAFLSGKLEGLVFFQRGEEGFLRTEPDYSKKKWSPAQQKHRERFQKVSAFCMHFKHNIIRPIWNLIPEKATGYGRFLQANMSAFDSNGDVADLSKLHFSDGRLPLPYNMVVEIVAGSPLVLKVNWENDTTIPGYDANDILMVMFASAGKFTGPVNSGVKRGVLEASVEVPSTPGAPDAVYLFFGAQDLKDYSPDQYFAV